MSAVLRSTPATHDREAWIRAASAALRAGGVDAVRVEGLARDLGTTKGSFYWHFRDRADLMEAILEWWELETRWVIAEASEAATPAKRLDRYFELVAANREFPPDAEILSWARREPAVSARVDQTENLRLGFIEAELIASGIPRGEARSRARIAYFATQGWVERASRGQESYPELPKFTSHLFALLRGARRR